jgi:peptidoglycan/LPS O-acetylase OafA/YrhL
MNYPTSPEAQQEYRADIDGLRAIAILSVIGFHAFPGFFGGGFVGVDIFFVISGYLITRLIQKELVQHQFSFARFYQRRIQRLFPALIVVLLACQLYSVFLYRDEAIKTAQSVAAGAAFIANYFFWRDGGYFDTSADTKPLLHLWSLSIEEQFYLFWPILLLLAYKIKRHRSLIFIVLFLASFVLSLFKSYSDPHAAFYSLQTRAWEFGIGVALAQIKVRDRLNVQIAGIHIQDLQSLLGLFLICFAIFLLKPTMPFPGAAALVPVLGAALIIHAGPTAIINRQILSQPLAVFFGLISYPLYLWHWPLLVFARIELSAPPPVWLRVVLITASIGLAWLTYKAIEVPFRRTQVNRKKIVFLLTTLFALGAIALWQSQGVIRYTTANEAERDEFASYYLGNLETRSLSVFESEFRHECNFYQVDKYYAGATTLVPKAKIDSSCYTRRTPTDKTVLIWGDSHAQMLNYGLKQTLPDNWSILQVASSGCYANAGYATDSDTNYCARSNWFAMQVIRSQKIDVVIIAQAKEHDLGQMQHIAQTLVKLGVERVIVMGPAPRWSEFLPKIILRQLWAQRPTRTTVGLDQEAIAKNRELARDFKRSDRTIFADVLGVFCNSQGCLTEVGDDKQHNLTTWDLGHLSQAASRYLAEKMLTNLVLGKTW